MPEPTPDNRPAGPPAEAYDVEQITRRTIDQVVVDGRVDGKEERVRYQLLARLAFKHTEVPEEIFTDFNRALVEESRFIDIVDYRYGYEPVLSPGSEVKPRLRSIVIGKALCSEVQRQEALAEMERMSGALHEYNGAQSGILWMRQILGILRTQTNNGVELSVETIEAFQAFMSLDPRFHQVGDGRIVLTSVFRGDPNRVVAVEPIEDLPGVLDRALSKLHIGYGGYFERRTLLGCLNGMGITVPHKQVDELFALLSDHPYVDLLADGRYRLRSPTHESVLRSMGNEVRRKPKGKGGHPRGPNNWR